MPDSNSRPPRRLKGPDGSSRALETLYDIAQRTWNTSVPAEAAGIVLDTLISRMATRQGAVFLAGNGSASVLAARGSRAAAEAGHCADRSTGEPFMLLQGKREPFWKWERVPSANPAREEIAFIGVPVPGSLAPRALLLADRVYDDSIHPAEDVRFLSAAAAFLSRHLSGNLQGQDGVMNGEGAAPLGRNLQQQIASWVATMEVSRRLRSDVHERLLAAVEKIVIAAALEKTGYVQTETARFLGINRNTLAKKIRYYGLKRRDR